MTVELLRWGALLDNMEKVAEPTGLLLSVENGYNPVDGSIVVSADVPLEWEAWFATPDGTDAVNPLDDADAGLHRYHYLRVWTGGGAGAAVDHPIDVNNPVPLGATGLTAEFSANGLPGDYWIVSARPNTPTEVTPWNLLDGARPVGPRRLVAPLALVSWQGRDPDDVLDCRHRFRPLCRIPGCCRVTVGDGRISHGDVDSIREAVERLPAEGGEICLQAGDFVEHVEIVGRRNVTITGCGRETRWSGEPGRTDPLLRLTNCVDTAVRAIAMTGSASTALVAERGGGNGRLRRTKIEHVSFTIADAGAVAAFDVDDFEIRRCRVNLVEMSASLSQDELIGRAAALFLSGDDLTIERCEVRAEVARPHVDGGRRSAHRRRIGTGDHPWQRHRRRQRPRHHARLGAVRRGRRRRRDRVGGRFHRPGTCRIERLPVLRWKVDRLVPDESVRRRSRVPAPAGHSGT